jgi:hypothetical protein
LENSRGFVIREGGAFDRMGDEIYNGLTEQLLVAQDCAQNDNKVIHSQTGLSPKHEIQNSKQFQMFQTRKFRDCDF